METDNRGFVLENGVMWTGKWWEQLPEQKDKTVSELTEEVKELLASGMAAKDVIPYLTKDKEAK